MKNKVKQIISVMLSLFIIIGMIPVGVYVADAATPTVKIVSFMRGEQTDLRSSELLEARVEGYNGNVRELTYKWSTTLGTYLYVYNSHNMYHIRNTPGEVEVYNSKKLLPTPDMVGRYYANEFSDVGFAWAAVHSNSIYDKSQLVGTVTVEVYDKDNNLLCSDSHEGKLVGGANTGFLNYDLKEDLDDVVIGLFEGDKRNVKDLLGESAVVHIVCIASTVMAGAIRNGDEYIELTKEADGDYYITADKAGTSTGLDGDALVDLTVQKTSCKFHRGSYESATTTVFVFKKPTTSTTTTTLTLDNLDDRCNYFINGVQGTEIDEDGDGKRDKVIFKDLTPNTDYMVEVRGEYQVSDEVTRYAYAFVYDTTKPVYKATVKTYLDGELADISAIHGENVNLYLHEDKENADYIELTKSDIGTYTAAVENGIYFPWHIEAGDHYHQAREYKLIIENANGELSLHHYSVKYDTNGGAFKAGEEVTTEVYSSMADVNVTENVPVREGFIFAGWEYNGKTYAPGTEVTSAISAPITLKAKWEKTVNVTINVTIDHQADGGYDHNETREELTVEFLEKTVDSPAFMETGDKLSFSEDGVTDEKGDVKPYVYSLEGEHLSKYTATDYTYTGLIESSTFGVAVSKSGYDVGAIEKYQDKSGNWIINIPLTYNPDDFELEFSVEMDKSVPVELYPDAVIVKIACWDADANEWVIISQQRTTETTVKPGVRVDIDKATGEGYGSYPVWKHDAEGNLYGYRAVVTGFIYNNSTIIVPTEKDHTKDDGLVIVTYTDGNYTATMGDIADGKKYSTSLNGAYFNDIENKQQGTLDGVITVERYNVSFDAQGGKVNSKNVDVAENQYYVPDFDAYVPTMENHSFLGWYLDAECIIPATEGELLTEDIILYAKWDKVLTGTVIVDGYYDSTHIVNQQDRATHALVELEEITPDGTYNIAGQTVEIQWNAENHFSEPVFYEFKGLEPDKTYRVDVYLINYKAEYQNSTTAINGNGDIHDDYNETDYTAVYPADSKLKTFVNIFLHFEPEEYIQNVEIDATRIGEGFRPLNALVKYYSQEIGAENDYELIVQHKGENDGVQVGMNTETGTNDGEYGEKVWKENFNGNLYNYQADLAELDGNEVEDWPISVVYGDPARWSPYNQASTGPLKVTLVPRRYKITYNWNNGTDYKEVDSNAHTWSHDTEITYVPARDGYTFDGWFDVNGNKVTKIDASVYADTELYAKWTPEVYDYTVNYLEEGTNNVLTSVKTASADFGATVTETAIAIEGYTVSGETVKSIVIDTENNVINFYYLADTVGGGIGGDESDSIPDKFQKKVIFKVVNGTWEDGTTADKATFLELKTDGNWSADGTAALTAPAGMTAYEGFTKGQWDVVPPSTVSGTDTEIYTYTFVRALTPVVPGDKVSYIVEYYKQNADGTYPADAFETEILSGNIGETVTAVQKLYDGYIFNDSLSTVSGELVAVTEESDILVLKLYYDVEPEEVPEETTAPDESEETTTVPGESEETTAPGESEETTTVPGESEETTAPGESEETTTVPGESEETTVPGESEETTTVPGTPDVPGGDAGGIGGGNAGGNDEFKLHVVFGKTDGIGWYYVSTDGGETYQIVFGNSTLEVVPGTQLIISVGDIMGDSFVFYVNGNKVHPDDDGKMTVTVDNYMLIGALSSGFEAPDIEESLNFFQKLINAIKAFFDMIASWFK